MNELFRCENSKENNDWYCECKRCEEAIELNKSCKNVQTTVIKSVRCDVRWLESLLEDPKLNIKVVHLVRDPRPAFYSGQKINHWDIQLVERCKKLKDDLTSFNILKPKYKNRIMNISYEELMSDTYGKSKELFSFLFGSDDLPKETLKFLREHQTNKKVKKKTI